MGSLSFAIESEGSGTLAPTHMLSWSEDPRPYLVIQEQDKDGIIGKPLGSWGGQTYTAVIVETSTTYTDVVTAARRWLNAHNSKGTVTKVQESNAETFTNLRMSVSPPEMLDPTNIRITLTFTQEAD